MRIRGITLDTGALIAIERRKQRGTQLLELARQRLAVLAVPVPVVAEWWRARTDVRERILELHLRLPFPKRACPTNIGPSDFGIVSRKRMVTDLARRTGEFQD